MVFIIQVTVGAVELAMSFVKLKASHLVIEILGTPVVMTLHAVGAERFNALTDNMALVTLEMFMIVSQAPVRGVMLERSLLLFAVTEVAVIFIVAVVADRMDLFG